MKRFSLNISAKTLGAMAVIGLTLALVVGASLWLLIGQEADGKVINVAGRQRMLSQKMTKEALLLTHHSQAWQQGVKNLLATAKLFDRSLQALIEGNPAMEIPPTKDPVIRKQLLKVRGLWQPFYQAVLKIAGSQGTGDPAFKAALSRMVAGNLTLLKEMNKAVGMYAAAAKKKVVSLEIMMLVSLGFAAVVYLIAWIGVRRGVLKPLQDLVHDMGVLAEGDLTVSTVDTSKQDEIGEVARALEKLRLTWGSSVREILNDASDVSASAGEIAAGNQDLSERTQSQAAAVEQISSAAEEMAANVRQNAEHAQSANQLAARTAQAAKEGGVAVDRTVEAMAALTESSKKIADIIEVVNEIAFQTNLLALNAAVEAARAGEAGRGFAVVAGEVRNLAGRSAEAARQIQELITESTRKVEQSNQTVAESGKLLSEIIENVQKVAATVADIDAASQEQAIGIDEINKALSQMDDGIQRNAALVEETAASAERLAGIARELEARMKLFKV